MLNHPVREEDASSMLLATLARLVRAPARVASTRALQALSQDGQQLVLVWAVGGGLESFVTQPLLQCCVVCEANPQEHARGPAGDE